MKPSTVHLGFEVGSGRSVEVPLAHTFVTGQTQLSGKTTTLRALVGRSGCRALAFVTKRGEDFEGRRIRPYLPREGEQPIHWRLVETILASALGTRSLKFERLWIINAAKGATSLQDVRNNVERLKAKAKAASADVYMLLGEYLDLVLPEMRALRAADELDLQPGLNVMHLAGVGPQLQALVIRAALERINQHEKGVLTVFPEAWEFAPRARAAPAKDEAIAMARKGAVLGNFLMCDSQDIAGVDTVVRQAASVWILGVQRELNELKRTIDSIPAGIAKPKSGDVATLGRGQFFVCWGRHCVKTYVQPIWMEHDVAQAIAAGEQSMDEVKQPPPTISPQEDEPMSAAVEGKLDALTDLLREVLTQRGPAPPAAAVQNVASTPHFNGAVDEEALYQRFKARLADEAPTLLKVLLKQPELQIDVERITINAEGKSLRGRLALMIHAGWFAETKKGFTAYTELKRTGGDPGKANVYRELKELTKMGFLTREGEEGYKAVAGMKVNIVKK